MSSSEVQRATVGLIATSPLTSSRTGVPNPGCWSMACWELATQQEMSSRQASEASSVFTAAPHTSEVTVSQHSQVEQSSCRKTSSGFPLILHYGEVYNYFIIYHNVIIIEIKCTINVICLNYSETIPLPPWSMKKNCLLRTSPWCQNNGDGCCRRAHPGESCWKVYVVSDRRLTISPLTPLYPF